MQSEFARQALRRLGSGDSLDTIARAKCLDREDLVTWWEDELATRLSKQDGSISGPVSGRVEVLRDGRGIPHILGSSLTDLMFGHGFALGQDRLWQLDYYRRRAYGRLSEVLGPSSLESDRAARIVGFGGTAERLVDRLPEETLGLLDAFSGGINTALDRAEPLPVEFDLLGHSPEPWAPVDTVAVWVEFRWYLTGRLPGIYIPELAKRHLGEGDLYKAFIFGEADEESIVPTGSYVPRDDRSPLIGETAGEAFGTPGSNNWAVAGSRAKRGMPLLASDPHIAFGALSCWYQVHLDGAGINAAGAGYVGVPGIIFGRNERVAWGLTNNICSQRDLYMERTDPARPGRFLFDGNWERVGERKERIDVRDSETVELKVISSRNGPLVGDLLADELGGDPVSLKWLGDSDAREITCLVDMLSSTDCGRFRDLLEPWTVPTWSFGFVDVDGGVGYQCAGRIPQRGSHERGFRPGWDPAHQWTGFIPFEELPRIVDPPAGWIRSANNRTAPEDFPHPLAGVWSSGHRARRIRQMLEAAERHGREDFAAMQTDVVSLRAEEGVPGLLGLLAVSSDRRVKEAADLLRTWVHRVAPESGAAAVFETFFVQWCRLLADERFPKGISGVMAGAASGLGLRLLDGDGVGWIGQGTVAELAERAMVMTLDEITARLGPDIDSWEWGRLHALRLRHLVPDRGELGELLAPPPRPVGGSGVTVCNTGMDPNYLADMGANFRLVVDLAETPSVLWTVDASGQSGQPGSPNYCDQTEMWIAGELHPLTMDAERVRSEALLRLAICPDSRNGDETVTSGL